jgi:hypothetical protein
MAPQRLRAGCNLMPRFPVYGFAWMSERQVARDVGIAVSDSVILCRWHLFAATGPLGGGLFCGHGDPWPSSPIGLTAKDGRSGPDDLDNEAVCLAVALG